MEKNRRFTKRICVIKKQKNLLSVINLTIPDILLHIHILIAFLHWPMLFCLRFPFDYTWNCFLYSKYPSKMYEA